VSPRVVVMELARLEAAHLLGLVQQFAELVEESAPDDSDPAVLRLVPDAYDDEKAAQEFRDLTAGDLLQRRRADAAVVADTLADVAPISDDPADPALHAQVQIRLDPERARAWMRTLAAIRLVLATRLGIAQPEDDDPDDPRFGIYHWLGYRLDGLVEAIGDPQQ